MRKIHGLLLLSAFMQLCISLTSGDKLIYGLDYNPRRDWYLCPSVDQIIEDLALLSPYTDRIRLYSFTDCNQTQLIMGAMAQLGVQFKLLLGMWTTNDTSLFAAEFAAMKYVFDMYPEQMAYVEAIIVGSETILRKEQTVSQVNANIQTVKSYLKTTSYPSIPVTFADIAQNFLYYPDLVKVVDIVFVNKFAYWEAQYISNAMTDIFGGLSSEEQKTSSKPFMVSETGWPDAGSAYYNAIPSDANAQYYFQNFICTANSQGLKYLYFAAFDDGWKQKWQMGPQGVEQHWGIFYFNRTAKPRINFACSGSTVTTLPPTVAPTYAPTFAPTDAPTPEPTTAAPTAVPTTPAPTFTPTEPPTEPHSRRPYTFPPDTSSPDNQGTAVTDGGYGPNGKIAAITVGSVVGVSAIAVISLAGYKCYQKRRGRYVSSVDPDDN